MSIEIIDEIWYGEYPEYLKVYKNINPKHKNRKIPRKWRDYSNIEKTFNSDFTMTWSKRKKIINILK